MKPVWDESAGVYRCRDGVTYTPTESFLLRNTTSPTVLRKVHFIKRLFDGELLAYPRDIPPVLLCKGRGKVERDLLSELSAKLN